MPSKSFKKKTSKKKLPMARNKIDNAQNKRIVNIEKKLRAVENSPELKFIDNFNAITILGVPAAAQINLLNGVVQGTTETTRLGEEIKPTSLQLRGTIFGTTSATQADFEVRIIVFWDRQSNGVAPTAAQLLDLTTITQAYHAPYNRDYQERFTVLWDHNIHNQFNTWTGSGTVLAATSKGYSKYIKLNRKVMYGLANGGTIADIATNSLYLLTTQSTAAGTGSPVAAQHVYGARVNFRDT